MRTLTSNAFVEPSEAVATTFALFGALFLVPQYLQVLRGLTPVQSGLILLPSSLVTVVALPR